MRLEPKHYEILGWHCVLNVCTEVGDTIDYHVHAKDHLSLVWRGSFEATTIKPSGIETTVQLASGGLGGWHESRIAILAGDTHRFRVTALEGGVASLECLWPTGIHEGSHGSL